MKHTDHLETRPGKFSSSGFIPSYPERRQSGFFIDPSFLIFIVIVATIIFLEIKF